MLAATRCSALLICSTGRAPNRHKSCFPSARPRRHQPLSVDAETARTFLPVIFSIWFRAQAARRSFNSRALVIWLPPYPGGNPTPSQTARHFRSALMRGDRSVRPRNSAPRCRAPPLRDRGPAVCASAAREPPGCPKRSASRSWCLPASTTPDLLANPSGFSFLSRTTSAKARAYRLVTAAITSVLSEFDSRTLCTTARRCRCPRVIRFSARLTARSAAKTFSSRRAVLAAAAISCSAICTTRAASCSACSRMRCSSA